MEIPERFYIESARHAFAVYDSNYSVLSGKEREEVATFLEAFGKLSQQAENHPRNLYEVSFLERGCVFIFIAEMRQVVGACKLGVKRLFEFAEGETHEILAPCLLDVFILPEYRRKHFFPLFLDAIQQFTGLTFVLFALDDPPQDFVEMLGWHCSDEASKFQQQAESILILAKAYKIARLRLGRNTFDGNPQFEMMGRLAEFIDRKYTVKCAPFETLDFGGNEEQLNRDYEEYLSESAAAVQVEAENVAEERAEPEHEQRPIEISEGEYEEFLRFRAERLAKKSSYYQVNDREAEVPARQLDMRNMGQEVQVITRKDPRQAHAEAFEASEDAAREVEATRHTPLSVDLQTAGYAGGRAQIVNYEAGKRPMTEQYSPKSAYSDTAELRSNRSNEMTSKIQFGGFYDGGEDVYKRRNDFVTMNDLAADTERRAKTEEKPRTWHAGHK